MKITVNGTTREEQNTKLIYSNGAQASHTGNTNLTNLRSFTIPANTLGPNDALEFVIIGSMTNNANTKTFRVRIGTAPYTLIALGLSSTANFCRFLTMFNRGATNSQANFAQASSSGVGTSTAAINVGTIDFTQDQDVNISVQLADGADTASIEAVYVRLLRA